jgi:hypothetical protein
MLKVIAVVIVVVFSDGGLATQTLIGKDGSTIEQCERAAPKLEAAVKQNSDVVAVATTCVEVNKPSLEAHD